MYNWCKYATSCSNLNFLVGMLLLCYNYIFLAVVICKKFLWEFDWLCTIFCFVHAQICDNGIPYKQRTSNIWMSFIHVVFIRFLFFLFFLICMSAHCIVKICLISVFSSASHYCLGGGCGSLHRIHILHLAVLLDIQIGLIL